MKRLLLVISFLLISVLLYCQQTSQSKEGTQLVKRKSTNTKGKYHAIKPKKGFAIDHKTQNQKTTDSLNDVHFKHKNEKR